VRGDVQTKKLVDKPTRFFFDREAALGLGHRRRCGLQLCAEAVLRRTAFSEQRTATLTPGGYLTRLSYRGNDRALFMKTADIVPIEAEDYYVRVHRTACVNIGKVVEVRDERGLVLLLSSGARVRVSRSRRRDVEPILRPPLRPARQARG
jgi:DNA-binding LytR/AlgR family response regulator